MKFGQIPLAVGVAIQASYLKHAVHAEILAPYGKDAQLDKNDGKVAKFQRKVPLAPAKVPLVEGQAPSPSSFTYEEVLMTLEQFGDFIPITDVVADLHDNPVIRDITESQGEQAGLTAEVIMWDKITAGNAVTYAGGKTARNQVVAAFTAEDLRRVIKSLNRQKAKRITKITESSVKYGTKSVEAAYVAFVHTDAKDLLRALPGFKHRADYGSMQAAHEHEFGAFEELRFVCSADFAPLEDAGGAVASTGMTTTSGANCDVYQMVIHGEDAWGCLKLRGSKKGAPITPMVRQPGNPTKGDELGQTGSLGWKMYFQAKILNETWLRRVEFAIPK